MYYWYICFFCQFHVVYSLTVLVVIITKPRKNTRFMKNLPFELEIKNLTEVKSDSRLSKSPLKATSFQLIWLSEGEAIFDIDFKQIKIKAGELLIISLNQAYSFDTTSDYSGKVILFSDSFFSQSEADTYFLLSSEILNPENLNQTSLLDKSHVEKIFSLLEEELKLDADSYQPLIIHSLLQTLLFGAERKLESGRDPLLYDLNENLARRFCNEVEKQFKVLKHTEFYMHALGVCEKTLTRQLKGTINTTPKKYLISRVILEVKRLLVYTDMSVKDISAELGFDEFTNFNKYVIQHAGMSPSAFREQFQIKQSI